jgi:hypothetical protein
MEKSTEEELKSILVLLKGNSNEEKVAGVLLAVKLLEMNILGPTESKSFMIQIFSLVTPDFIVRLIGTLDKKKLIRQAGLNFLAFSIQWGMSTVFKESTSQLIDLLFSSLALADLNSDKSGIEKPLSSVEETDSDQQFLLDILLALKWIAIESNIDFIDRILERILLNVGKVTTQVPIFLYPSLLNFIVEISGIRSKVNPICKSEKGLCMLSIESGEMLRMLIVKGFHGGAPEAIRDSSLLGCLHLISPDTSFSSDWSLESETAVYNTGSAVDSKSKSTEKSPVVGKFAMLLASIVGIEMHLLLEEALALFKEPQGEPQNLSTGDFNDPLFERRTKYNTIKVDMKKDIVDVRIKRLVKMIPCCLSILNGILLLLVGKEGDEEGAEENAADDSKQPLWAALSSVAMLHIRQTVHSIFQKVFDFLKEISDISQETLSNIFGNITDKNREGKVIINETIKDNVFNNNGELLIIVVQHTTATLSLWILEDEALREPFVRNLHLILQWSIVAKQLKDSRKSVALEIKEDESNQIMNWKATNLMAWTTLSQSSTSNLRPLSLKEDGIELEQDNIGDILHYVLPCLASISDNLAKEDELAERIYTLSGGCLFSRLVNIIILMAINTENIIQAKQILSKFKKSANLKNSGDEKDKLLQAVVVEENSLNRICHTCSSACDLLTNFFTWQKDELCILIRNESEKEAIMTIFVLTDENFPDIPDSGLFELPVSLKNGNDRYIEKFINVLVVTNRTLTGYINKSSDINCLISLDDSIYNLIHILNSINDEKSYN